MIVKFNLVNLPANHVIGFNRYQYGTNIIAGWPCVPNFALLIIVIFCDL